MVMADLNDNNNFFIMANSNAKGKPVNLMQIMGALGQDIFKTKRIQKEVNNRALPHFHQNDDTPLARGYIEHSYLDGLSPQEFFFHHMTGREGLIDTAIKTAETGYISRKLMKGLEDVGVKYDGTVRTGNNIITQGIKEINSGVPEIVKLGHKRLISFGLTVGAIPNAFRETGKALNNVTEDEMEALKRFVPDWSKNSTLIPVGRDEKGYLKQSFFKFQINKRMKFLNGPFANMIFNVIDVVWM